ncbi:hypothetical protein L218DRAFT_1010111 [Marasmius fiardii PR-910]|nr:hypothetical protein L218DRAFT_1010111 [Marasmius fiardii PR-910]
MGAGNDRFGFMKELPLSSIQALHYRKKAFESRDGLVGESPITLIQEADVHFFIKQFIVNITVNLTFPQGGRLVDYQFPTVGLISDFSAYGPNFDLRFKPTLFAPGGFI